MTTKRSRDDAVADDPAASRLAGRIGPEPDRRFGFLASRMARDAGLAGADGAARQSAGGAVKIAATVRPRVLKGDLRGSDFVRLCNEAPKDATLVVFHTAVLDYVSAPADREAFAEQAMRLSPYWVSNEFPRVFPSIAKRAGTSWPSGRFLMSVNGSRVAWTDPHGASLEWIAGDSAAGRS